MAGKVCPHCSHVSQAVGHHIDTNTGEMAQVSQSRPHADCGLLQQTVYGHCDPNTRQLAAFPAKISMSFLERQILSDIFGVLIYNSYMTKRETLKFTKKNTDHW